MNQVRVLRGEPDDVEVAALVAGLAAVASVSGLPDDETPVDEWTNRARSVRGNGAGVTAKTFGGRWGRHHADAWRWSLHS